MFLDVKELAVHKLNIRKSYTPGNIDYHTAELKQVEPLDVLATAELIDWEFLQWLEQKDPHAAVLTLRGEALDVANRHLARQRLDIGRVEGLSAIREDGDPRSPVPPS